MNFENLLEDDFKIEDEVITEDEGLEEGELITQDAFSKAQDSELLKMSPTDIIESIRFHQLNLNKVVAATESLREGRNAPAANVSAVRSSMALRQRLSRFYGMEQVTIGEALHPRLITVLAFEEEEKKERNFFMRIIDSIVKALKWLAKKIGELFGGGDKQEKEAEKLKEKAEELTEALESHKGEPVAAKMDEALIETYNKLFAFLGDNVGGKEIADYIKNMVEVIKKVEKQVGITTLHGLSLGKMIDAIKNTDPGTYDDAIKAISGVPVQFTSEFEKVSGEAFSKYFRESPPANPENSSVFAGLPGGRAIVYWEEKADGVTTYNSSFFNPLEGEKKTVKLPGGPEDIVQILGAANDFIRSGSQSAAKVAELVKKAASHVETLGTSYNSLKDTRVFDDPRFKQILKLSADVTRIYGNCMTAFGQAGAQCTGVAIGALEYAKASLTAMYPKEEKKKPDTPAEEEKK